MSSFAPTVDVVIVNWRSDDFLSACLDSLQAAASAVALGRVVVVDNECGKERRAWETRPLPMHVIRNTENAGFARACNQGARTGRSEYLLFLNPDMLLTANALELPLQFLAQPDRSRVGICGIRLLDAGGHASTSCNRLPTLKNLLAEALGIDKLPGHAYDGRTVDPATLGSSGFAEQIMGAFFLVRRPVYEALGGFDERFFVYFEEVDFSLRCRQLGYTSYYLSEASAYHRGGASSEQVLDMRLFYSLRSRMQYAKKHFRWYEILLLGLVTLLLEPLCRIAWALLLRQRRTVSHTIKAYARLWRFLVLETGQ